MVPVQSRRFRLQRASAEDRLWLQEVLNREGRQFNTRVEAGKENDLLLGW
jgi:poly-gamma-glutamate synthesis protein (capsule biosynthesis protein)